MTREFRIAPMDGLMSALTTLMLALPVLFAVFAFYSIKEFAVPAIFLVLIYLWIWLRFRPTSFIVHPDRIDIIWPLKTRHISRHQITAIEILDRKQLRERVGTGLRVGAGGVWGGFGWLWSSKLGLVQMYVSRTDRFVFITLNRERPWLITPYPTIEFVNSLSI
jgi:hypothetical protein